MNRNKLYQRFSSIKPQYYTIINDRILLLWLITDDCYDTNIISAFLTFNGPAKFYTHKPKTHSGNYLFRRGQSRIYRADIRSFPEYFWNKTTNTCDRLAMLRTFKFLDFNPFFDHTN